ncbi:MAG: amidohydrolase family protein, partial [Hyphomicrobiales bacterium]
PIGAIEAGRRADLIVLDTDHPALVGRPSDRWLDAFIFCGNDSPVRDVMVGGRMVVKDGAHLAAEPVRARFRATMRRLAAAL